MTVGYEWTHPQCFGQVKGLAIPGFGIFDLRGITIGDNVAEEAQGIRLMTSFLVATGMLEGSDGECARLLQVAGAQMRLAQGEEQRCPATHSAARGGML